jgi:hypothetical protein
MTTFQDSAAPVPPPPPPPPPRKSRTGMWIGIVIGVIVLCLCCVVVVGVGYYYRTSIPGINTMFATPTPQGVYYNNSTIGFSVYYPVGWVYEEQGTDSVIFASSQTVLNSSSSPTSGAAMGFIVSTVANLNMPAGVDPTSPESVLNGFVKSSFSSGATVVENVKSFSLGAYPAASAVLTVTPSSSTGTTLGVYMTVLSSGGKVVIGIGFTPESQLTQYRPTFDQMLRSFVLTP